VRTRRGRTPRPLLRPRRLGGWTYPGGPPPVKSVDPLVAVVAAPGAGAAGGAVAPSANAIESATMSVVSIWGSS
jgi:hypothetical protein